MKTTQELTFSQQKIRIDLKVGIKWWWKVFGWL